MTTGDEPQIGNRGNADAPELSGARYETDLRRAEEAVAVMAEIVKRCISPDLEGISGSNDIVARIETWQSYKPDPGDSRSNINYRLSNISTLIRELSYVIALTRGTAVQNSSNEE